MTTHVPTLRTWTLELPRTGGWRENKRGPHTAVSHAQASRGFPPEFSGYQQSVSFVPLLTFSFAAVWTFFVLSFSDAGTIFGSPRFLSAGTAGQAQAFGELADETISTPLAISFAHLPLLLLLTLLRPVSTTSLCHTPTSFPRLLLTLFSLGRPSPRAPPPRCTNLPLSARCRMVFLRRLCGKAQGPAPPLALALA